MANIVKQKRKFNLSFYFNILLGFFIIYSAIQSASLPVELKIWIYLLGLILIIASPSYQFLLWMGQKKEERLQFSDNLPPLIKFAWTGDLEQLLICLQSNPQIDCRDHHGATALMYASAANQAKIVEKLLQMGAKKHLKTHKGNNAMFFAIQEKNNEIIYLLNN